MNWDGMATREQRMCGTKRAVARKRKRQCNSLRLDEGKTSDEEIGSPMQVNPKKGARESEDETCRDGRGCRGRDLLEEWVWTTARGTCNRLG